MGWFLDRHYVWRSHDPVAGIWSNFFWGLIVFRLPFYGVFHFCVFFSSRLFSDILFSDYFMEQLGQTRLLCFPLWQSNFFKLFNGGLQYKFIQTFFEVKWWEISDDELTLFLKSLGLKFEPHGPCILYKYISSKCLKVYTWPIPITK